MELEYWLRLNNVRQISPLICARLLERFGSPRAICEAGAAELAACGVKVEALAEFAQPDHKLIASQLHWAEQPEQCLLTLADPQYPELLKKIPDPPPVLFVKGNPAILSNPQIALVGSRNPSPGGLKAANEFAALLAQAGFTITSGLAVGIDGASHRGALAGGGNTIAVLGSGLSRIYPSEHRSLAKEITTRGAVISEFSSEIPPLALHFPRRNRIISGLSLGTCVIEAALQSGSLITARLAAEQGREVFAMPGSIYNSQSRGCHKLIQDGAKLVTSVEDILCELQHEKERWCILPSMQHQPLELDHDSHQLLQWVGFETTSVDQLTERSGFPVSQVVELLLNLELKGHVRVSAGGYCRI